LEMVVPWTAPFMFEESLLRRWMEEAQAGDAASFEQLLKAHEVLVLRTAQRLLLDPDEARDAAQEVFLRLHRSLDRFDEERPLKPWLYRTTVNICHDFRRKRRRVVSLEAASNATCSGPSPYTQLAALERWRLVELALETIPERERDAIVLRDLEGLGTAEVAGMLGTNESTVRSQISKGRLKIRQFIESHAGRKA
jgi:RNA polymerase sigma-70 factor, ECF subfamily